MSKCDYCRHVEMCGWRKRLEERGCDFFEDDAWTPCCEKMPNEDGRYYVTRFDFVSKVSFIDILWYEKGTWWNRRFVGDYAVIAWMPLPKPYQGETE